MKLMEMMLEVVGVLVYDLITLLPGSAIWAPLGQDYYFNTSACSRLVFNGLVGLGIIVSTELGIV